MDKKDWTPEELELKETLNKLYENDTRMPSKPLDLSFMNEAAEKKSGKKRINFKYVAAAVILIAASSFFTAVFMSNDYASAVQEKIERKVFEMKHGVVVATDEEFAEEGETVWEITDFEVAKKAKELVPELPIPGYVPEGYEFEKLVLHLFNDGRYVADYNYAYNNENIFISCQTLNGDFDSSIFPITETIDLFDRTIITWADPLLSTTGATVLINDSVVIITPSQNNLEYNKIIFIAKKLI